MQTHERLTTAAATPVATASTDNGHAKLRIAGLTCASDAILLERRLAWVDGVIYVMANPLNELVYVTFDESRTTLAEIRQRIDESEFGPVIPDEAIRGDHTMR